MSVPSTRKSQTVNIIALRNFYADRTVLVTGHTGFKGSWLLALLNDMGANVVGVSLDVSETSVFHQAKLESLCAHHICDIRNLNDFQSIVSHAEPQIVFHLAAQALVGVSRLKPVDTFSTNVQGAVNVLQSCRAAQSIVIASSDKCYAPSSKPLSERAALGGVDPYSASKSALEHVVASYRDVYFNKGVVSSVRASNVIGGGDWAEARLIPDVLRAIQSQTTLMMRHPRACRAWQHVLEPLWGYLMLGAQLFESPEYAKPWNFGPSKVASVSAVVYGFAKAYGVTPSVQFAAGATPETMMLRLDSTQAEYELGWTNKLTWEQALHWAASDYLAFEKGDAHAHIRHRIERYAELWGGSI